MTLGRKTGIVIIVVGVLFLTVGALYPFPLDDFEREGGQAISKPVPLVRAAFTSNFTEADSLDIAKVRAYSGPHYHDRAVYRLAELALVSGAVIVLGVTLILLNPDRE